MEKIVYMNIDKPMHASTDFIVRRFIEEELVSFAENEKAVIIGKYGTNKSELKKYLPKEA